MLKMENIQISLLQMPNLVMHKIFMLLDAESISAMASTCTHFSKEEKTLCGKLPFAQACAMDKILKDIPIEKAKRWKHLSWIQRLYVEETLTPFSIDTAIEASNGLQFTNDGILKLPVHGPKIVVSSLSTRTNPLLRWSFFMHRNMAIEIASLDINMKDEFYTRCIHHKSDCYIVGVSSHHVIGTKVETRIPVSEGCHIEVCATNKSFQVIVTHFHTGKIREKINNEVHYTLYSGPRKVYIDLQDIENTSSDIVLGMTLWLNAQITPDQLYTNLQS
jgi:hypothetical protein